MRFLDMIFGKKEEEPEFYSTYILVRQTQYSKEEYIQDEFNMEIVLMNGPQEVRVTPFSKEELKAVREIYPDVPVMVEELSEEFKMEFEKYFGEVIL